jgi:hypothetical protein
MAPSTSPSQGPDRTRTLVANAKRVGEQEAYVKILARLLYMQANQDLTPEARNALVDFGGWVAEQAQSVGRKG